ncbi:TonB-dependent receptor [Coraliomargarita sp. SDUM461003]|uniref:TonB-dependent receptor n=1 Tax=Thalassobacterium maritimum TaxID=3041265 RepID=A0ABU1ASQ7_9BACT|nr:TonB-dependent receptor [Coraliomargarita sp. SDUM461003]MDQ8207194.1 TonB-dependent receptor [Coraliomargarita sp. SDUM461003]
MKNQHLYTNLPTHRSLAKRALGASCIAASLSISTLQAAEKVEEQLNTEEPEHSFVIPAYTLTSDETHNTLNVTERDLNLRQANDLEDTLSIDPSVTVGGSNPKAQKIYVRNLGEGLLNIKVDGATQSGALFHHTGRIAIEPELLKQVEIQPGVGSSTQGPGALGGSVNFVTKDPEDFLSPDQQVGALIKNSYFSNTDGYKGSATVFGRISENWTSLVSYVYSDQGDLEDADGDSIEGSETKQEVILGKVVGYFGNGHTLRMSFENLDEEGMKTQKPEWAPGPGNSLYPMESTRQTASLNHEFEPIDLEWLHLKTHLSYTTADITQDGPWGAYIGEIESYQFDIRNIQAIQEHSLEYGVDYRKDEVYLGPSSDPHLDSEDASVTGLFLQGDFQVSDPLSVSAGARADFYQLEDRLGQEFDHEGISPNIGFTYEFTPEWSLSASYATAYRGPDINDAFKLEGATNAADIEAESAENYEFRLKYAKDGFSAEAGAYWHHVDDLISTSPDPWSKTYDNVGELKTEGFFARVSYGTESYNVSLQYNQADTTIDGNTATRYQYGSIVSSIGNTWVLDAFWTPIDQLDVGWNIRLVEEINDIDYPMEPGADIDKPGYVTNDFYLRWRPEFLENVTVNFTVKNVFDEDYVSHGSMEDMRSIPGYGAVYSASEPGRDFRISVSMLF